MKKIGIKKEKKINPIIVLLLGSTLILSVFLVFFENRLSSNLSIAFVMILGASSRFLMEFLFISPKATNSNLTLTKLPPF